MEMNEVVVSLTSIKHDLEGKTNTNILLNSMQKGSTVTILTL